MEFNGKIFNAKTLIIIFCTETEKIQITMEQTFQHRTLSRYTRQHLHKGQQQCTTSITKALQTDQI